MTPTLPEHHAFTTVRTRLTPVAAGLAVKASDTGRVLMLQRADTPGDPAGGKWEFPGGRLNPGEGAHDAARREWAEEIGRPVPDGVVTGTWLSTNGVYQGFIHEIPREADLDLNPDHENRQVMNPDDPDGDRPEVAAWWEPLDLPQLSSLRQEARDTPWGMLV